MLHTFLQGLEKQGLPGPQRGQSHQFTAQADGLALDSEDRVPTFPSLPDVSGSMCVHVNGSLPKKEGTDQMDCQPCRLQCGFLLSVPIPQWS